MGREQAEKLWSSIRGLGGRRLAALALVGLAVMLVVGVGAYYLSQPLEQTLYSGLSRDDVSRIGGVLKDNGIGFDVSTDGTAVLVGTGDTARARMLLAEKGLPQSNDSGYELFNQIGSFGLTSFMQDVTRTRALEGELARTIQSMTGIKAARVHLVLPDPGSFRSDQQPASASVVIRTENPSDISAGQAIRHLVASAVPGLKLDNVTVLNTEGAILASGDDAGSASAGKMAMVEQTVNRDIEEKIRRTLTPYVGIDNFRVSVLAQLNMDKKTMSETIFDPASRVERSIRTVKQNDLAQNSSNGDGAATVQENLPDQKGLAGGGGKASNQTNERREELTNYEVSSKTVETSHDGYVVEKLSVAILVNKARLIAAAGTGADAVSLDQQVMEIEQLVASAAGISKDRGDVLKVSTVAFVDDGPQPVAEAGIMSLLLDQTGILVKALAIIAVIVVVIFLGLRPTIRAIVSARPALEAPAPVALLESADGDQTPGEIGGRAAIAGEAINLIEDVTKKMSRSPQKRLEQIVEFDEAQAAAILRQWLHQEEAA
jgi:flagellar M-ring protein FliF